MFYWPITGFYRSYQRVRIGGQLTPPQPPPPPSCLSSLQIEFTSVRFIAKGFISVNGLISLTTCWPKLPIRWYQESAGLNSCNAEFYRVLQWREELPTHEKALNAQSDRKLSDSQSEENHLKLNIFEYNRSINTLNYVLMQISWKKVKTCNTNESFWVWFCRKHCFF